MTQNETIAALIALNAQEAVLLKSLAAAVVPPPVMPPPVVPPPVVIPPNLYIDNASRGTLHAPDAAGKWDVGIGGNQTAAGTVTFIVNGSFGTSTTGTRAVLQDGVVYIRQLDGSWKSFTRAGVKPTTVVVRNP